MNLRKTILLSSLLLGLLLASSTGQAQYPNVPPHPHGYLTDIQGLRSLFSLPCPMSPRSPWVTTATSVNKLVARYLAFEEKNTRFTLPRLPISILVEFRNLPQNNSISLRGVDADTTWSQPIYILIRGQSEPQDLFWTSQPIITLHEVTHKVLNYWYFTQPKLYPGICVVSEGASDFFPASFMNNPVIGYDEVTRTPIRTLELNLPSERILTSLDGTLSLMVRNGKLDEHDASQILSWYLWALRRELNDPRKVEIGVCKAFIRYAETVESGSARLPYDDRYHLFKQQLIKFINILNAYLGVV